MKTFALAVLLFLQVPAAPRIQIGAITGRIQLPDGHPAASIRVFAIQANPGAPDDKALFAAVAQTDTNGGFKLQDLPYGSYYIAAGLLESLTYYPGVTKLTAARATAVSSSGARAALEFTLDPNTFDTLMEVKQVPQNAGAIRSTGKAVTATTKIEVRQILQAESDREWWAARVIELQKDGRVKIHYLGWDASFDEVVPRSRLQLDDKALEQTRQPAMSSKQENTEKGKVPVNAGPIESTGKAVADTTKLAINQVLQVESGKEFWAARVIELQKDGRVKIHYLGWDASFDEVVPRSRLQLDDNAIEKTQQPQQPQRPAAGTR